MSLSIAEQLDAIFNIPKDGSNIKEENDESQENSYADAITEGSGEAFETKATKLRSTISKDAPPVDVEYINKEDPDGEKKEKIEQVSGEVAKQSTDKFEKILTQSVRSEKSVSVEVLPMVQKSSIDNKVVELEENDADENTSGSPVNLNSHTNHTQIEDVNGWLLIPPTPMYSNFYAQKSILITNITRTGKQLPIDQLIQELKSSYVNTTVELSDLQGMYEKLSQIQNFLDRVVQIKILATSQCSALKRAVELLRGVLAKVCYEKPAARQDGVNYDHMRDIEMYACHIESLEQSAKDVYHNLLEAKEILSRKISVAIELFKQQHMTDNVEKNMNVLPSNVKSAIQKAEKVDTQVRVNEEGFDKLEVQEIVKNVVPKNTETKKKTGQIDWLD